jgi:hypothetical protein
MYAYANTTTIAPTPHAVSQGAPPLPQPGRPPWRPPPGLTSAHFPPWPCPPILTGPVRQSHTLYVLLPSLHLQSACPTCHVHGPTHHFCLASSSSSSVDALALAGMEGGSESA